MIEAIPVTFPGAFGHTVKTLLGSAKNTSSACGAWLSKRLSNYDLNITVPYTVGDCPATSTYLQYDIRCTANCGSKCIPTEFCLISKLSCHLP